MRPIHAVVFWFLIASCAATAHQLSPPSFPPPAFNFGGAQAINRAEWYSGNDYPRAAVVAHHTGTADISFTIGVNGRVSNCRVVASSGHEELDSATCRLLTRRARFKPAMDADNRPKTTSATMSVPWRLWP
jgi:protein TonB